MADNWQLTTEQGSRVCHKVTSGITTAGIRSERHDGTVGTTRERENQEEEIVVLMGNVAPIAHSP